MTDMISRFLLPATSLTIAFGILLVSLFNASSLSYKVADLPSPLPAGPNAQEKYFVNYQMPDIQFGTLEPMRVLSSIKDKVKVAFVFDSLHKSQALLDNANERLSVGESLIRDGKINEGLASIARAQSYLLASFELARTQDSYRANTVLTEISMASLKHRERIESLMAIMPDEARSFAVESLERTKHVYTQSKLALETDGMPAPVNPFETPGN